MHFEDKYQRDWNHTYKSFAFTLDTRSQFGFESIVGHIVHVWLKVEQNCKRLLEHIIAYSFKNVSF